MAGLSIQLSGSNSLKFLEFQNYAPVGVNTSSNASQGYLLCAFYSRSCLPLRKRVNLRAEVLGGELAGLSSGRALHISTLQWLCSRRHRACHSKLFKANAMIVPAPKSSSLAFQDEAEFAHCLLPLSTNQLINHQNHNTHDSLCSLEPKIKFATLLAVSFLLLYTHGWLLCAPAYATATTETNSIAASHLGQKIATVLRSSGFPDQAIVFLMATLPIVELRGAIPVAYWMGLEPVKATILAVLGNALPVPLILFYLGPLVEQAAKSTGFLRGFATWFLENTRQKAGPIQEFKWLGLMLFVAVPLPGTGAWSGSFAAHILGMPFWSAFTANFVGVVFAGLLVNLLCKLGLKWASVVGAVLFLASTFVWSFLRWIRRGFSNEKIEE